VPEALGGTGLEFGGTGLVTPLVRVGAVVVVVDGRLGDVGLGGTGVVVGVAGRGGLVIVRLGREGACCSGLGG